MLKLNSTGKSFGRRKMQVAARKHRRHQFETLEKRMLLAGDVSSAFHADSVPENRLHNVSLPADVDASGQVSALDALMIINRIGRENISIDAGSKQAGTGADSAFYDVNNDRAVTALDALVVINSLQLAALPLEAETAAFTVTSTADSGAGSLRQAILGANASTTAAEIMFAIPNTDPGFVDVDSSIPGGDADADVFRIQPLSALPAIDNVNGMAVTLDGTTQQMLTGDTSVFGPEVELDGALASASVVGLYLVSDGIAIRGLVINSFSSIGVFIDGSEARVAGNFIGTDATGTLDFGNGWNGIEVRNAAANVVIGGSVAADRNVISGNALFGISSFGGVTNLQISGNYIGTSANGLQAIRNERAGITLANNVNTLIGGPTTKYRNIISGNGEQGIFATGSAVRNLMITSNYIGINATGDAAIPNGGNGDSQGIRLEMGVSNVTIGAPGAGNVISGNLSNGIGDTFVQDLTIQSNFIGTDATGTFAIPNQGAGISFSDARNALIGGADPSERNVISGNRSPSNNGNGISLGGSDLRVIGNYIGTDITGTIDIGNIGEGISVGNAVNVQIGGSNPGEGNVVSANGRSGINLRNSDNVRVAGNFVGTSADGSQDLGNAGRGILAPHGSTDVLIEDNLASGNGDHGIHSWDGINHTIRNNRVGTTADGTAAMANDGFGVFIESTATAIVDGNLISGNANSGIRVIDNSRSIEPKQWLVSEGGNGRYYLETPLLSWTDAEAMAVALGGHLADITDQAENDFLTQTFVNDRRSWIGLNDADTEGTFVWSSGEVFDLGVFESFGAAEPNGGTRENYVELFSPGQWNDAGNSSDKPGIMEFQTAPDMNLIQSLLASITVNGNQIGTNALGDMAIPNHSGIAVSLLGSTKLTIVDNQISGNTTDGIKVFGDAFVPAQITRNNIGTTADGLNVLANGRPGIHLASASNIEVTDNVSVGSSASSGLIIDESREITARGNYLGVASDGVTAMPNDAFGLFVLRSYDLDIVDNVISGNRLSGVRIQESAFDPILTQWSVADGGNDNWYWITPDQRTWDHSKALAQSLGANLVTVNSEQENMFITDTLLPLVSRGGTAWNGFNDVASDGSFVWSSEEPVTYSKWAANEPSGGTSENYVYFAADGSWKTWGVGVDVAIIEFTTQPDPADLIAAYGEIRFTGNRVGVGSDGTTPVPNADGFEIADSFNIVIGDSASAGNNIIAHNLGDGVSIRGTANVTVMG